MSRVLCWFSCGAASAVAAKLAVEKYGDRAEVLYCDTLSDEHPDNRRFMADVSEWLGKEVKVLSNEKYSGIYEVFRRERWLVGPAGAKCTALLKKQVRFSYQEPDDVHVFGYPVGEEERIKLFKANNPELLLDWVLIDAGITKRQCLEVVHASGIELPAMYKLGYRNNNCIGCVKGGQGYWNKIRKDFPDVFLKMAKQERELDAAINKVYRNGKRLRLFLDELPKGAGHYEAEPDIECGPHCMVQGELL